MGRKRPIFYILIAPRNILLCSANKLATGDVKVAGNSNLVAGNIKKGVSIFGVTGTYEMTERSTAGNFVFWKWTNDSARYKTAYGIGQFPWLEFWANNSLSSNWAQAYFISTSTYDFSIFRKIYTVTRCQYKAQGNSKSSWESRSYCLGLYDPNTNRAVQSFYPKSYIPAKGGSVPSPAWSSGSFQAWNPETFTVNAANTGKYKITLTSMYGYMSCISPEVMTLKRT